MKQAPAKGSFASQSCVGFMPKLSGPTGYAKRYLNALLVSPLLLLLTHTAHGGQMTATSPHFKEGKSIHKKQAWNAFGCKGKNIAPEINISNVPRKARALAVTIYDPDAPTQSGWWHLLAYNIPPETQQLPYGFTPETLKEYGIEFGTNDGGSFGYIGPCPPKGSRHRYILTVYALKSKLQIPEGASAAVVSFNIIANSIDRSNIVARYER